MMIINLFDSRILGQAGGVAAARTEWPMARQNRHGPAPIVARSTESPRHVLDRVRAQINHRGSLWLLRIICHGNSAFLQLGTGVTARNTSIFQALSGYFTRNGPGIAIHGCLVASSVVGQPSLGGNKPGIQFLRAIARVSGALTRACTRVQYDDQFHFNGRLVIVRPDGEYLVVQPPGMMALDTDRRYYDWSTFSTARPAGEQWIIGPSSL